jgi:hypothetical protein
LLTLSRANLAREELAPLEREQTSKGTEKTMTTFLVVCAILALIGYVVVRARRTEARGSSTSGQPSLGGGMPKIRGNGRYSVEVVGESHYAKSFKELMRKHKPSSNDEEAFGDALLTLEDDNPHDRNAVSVTIEGLRVGYLSREMAVDFREAIARDGLQKYRQFAVGARLYWGGDDELHSVSLDLPEE